MYNLNYSAIKHMISVKVCVIIICKLNRQPFGISLSQNRYDL